MFWNRKTVTLESLDARLSAVERMLVPRQDEARLSVPSPAPVTNRRSRMNRPGGLEAALASLARAGGFTMPGAASVKRAEVRAAEVVPS